MSDRKKLIENEVSRIRDVSLKKLFRDRRQIENEDVFKFGIL
jgi:hypothetical protein